ncbi:MAG: hypothetical protein V1744_08770 [Candidatus Altiarchaeota archaeon]
MPKTYILIAIMLLVVVAGCIQSSEKQTGYTCPDQTVVDDPSKCPEKTQITATTVTITTTTIQATTSNVVQTDLTSTTQTTETTTSTTTTLQTTNNSLEISVVSEYFQGADYIWYYFVPSIVDYDVPVETNIQVNNSHNTTFHLYVKNPVQSDKLRKAFSFTDFLGGEYEFHSIRSFNQTLNLTGNWSITIDNRMEGSTYTIKWTFINPPERTKILWAAWQRASEGCRYYDNNGTLCGFGDFRECWNESLSLCTGGCCRLTDHRKDKNITWYQKCVSEDEYFKIYGQDVGGFKVTNLDNPYFWQYAPRYKENNCQDPYPYTKY